MFVNMCMYNPPTPVCVFVCVCVWLFVVLIRLVCLKCTFYIVATMPIISAQSLNALKMHSVIAHCFEENIILSASPLGSILEVVEFSTPVSLFLHPPFPLAPCNRYSWGLTMSLEIDPVLVLNCSLFFITSSSCVWVF